MTQRVGCVRLAGISVLALGACLANTGCSKDGGPASPDATRTTVSGLALQRLQTTFPGVHVDRPDDGPTRIYGAAMTTGATPVDASERFRSDHADALGVRPDELVQQDLRGRPMANATPPGIGLMYDRQTGQYKFWLFRYGQVNGGVPVHGAGLQTLVRNAGTNPVVWASSSLRDLTGFAAKPAMRPRAADADKTLRGIRASTDFTGRALPLPTKISSLSPSKLVVFAGTERQTAPARMALAYTAETDGALAQWEIVADAESGDVLDAHAIIVFDNVTGTVAGNVTQGDKSIECADEVPTAYSFAEVTGGGASAFTDVDGAFVLTNPGTTAIDVMSPSGGQFFDVTNFVGASESLTSSVLPPGPVSFLHNAANTDPLLIAQANGYANANQVRRFLLGYLPSYPTISSQVNMPVIVNRNDGFCPGNAWYDPSIQTINFCQGSATYGNTSFASVSQHEYGHHIVQMGGSGQGAYGEGMGDTIAALLAGTPGLGYGFFLNQCTTALRNADNTCQFLTSGCSSCGSEIHACGQLISGAIWSVRKELILTNPTGYADIINALALSSIPMHQGTAINAQIAIDLLTLDDNDGNIDNGSPHYQEICKGFAAHGMTCPPLKTGLSVSPLTTLAAEGPTGGPFAPASVTYTLQNLGPTATIQYQVTPQSPTTWLGIGNGSGTLAIGQQAQVTVSIDQAVAGTLANGPYSAIVQFTNTTDGVGNTTRNATLQVGVPIPIFTETFEGGLGSFALSGGTANLWHVTANCASAQPGHSTPNSLYFGVDTSCTYQTGLISAGTVTSTAISVADTSVVKLRFKYFLQTERLSSYDKATAQVSVNGGPFVIVAGNSGGTVQQMQDGTGLWQSADIDISSLVGPAPAPATVAIRFGFDTIDSAVNTFAGFVVDDVELRAFVPQQNCTTDAQCNNGAFCDGVEHCVAGTCAAGTPINCNDGVACTVDTCNETTDACVNTASNAACDDGQVCNGAEVCNPTMGCQAGTPPNCNDNDACTTDSCNPAAGCQHVAVNCADSSECTTDSCNPATGCQHAPVADGTTCGDDANVCTNDVCSAGACAHPNNTNPCADDGNVCTNDVCAAGACSHPNNTASCADDGSTCTNDVCSGGTCTHPTNGTCSAGAFLESGGQVVIEAEHFGTNTGRASHTWDVTSNGSASGGQTMVANPNNAANINTGYTTGSPQLDYRVNFLTTGTYQVWVRGLGAGTADRTVHSGIDGTGPASADRLSGFTGTLGWQKATLDGASATISVTAAGLHTINIWMREDGFQIDKILLTTSASFTPTGAGPAESARGATCTSSANCDDSNPCTSDSCVTGLCQFVPAASGTACATDNNVCTNDVCNAAGACTHPNNTAACTDDGNVCTNDVCSGGACTHPNNTVACATDNDSCTNDVCSGGVCTHPSNGSCGTAPCTGLCSNPTIYTGPSLQSGNIGTGAVCYQTTANLAGGNCGNFVSPRTLSVNGTQMSCNSGNWASLPAKRNGGYCITTTAGNQPWAFITTW